MENIERRWLLGTVLVVLGSALAVSSLFLPWYQTTITSNNCNYEMTCTQGANYYLGLPGQSGTVVPICSPAPACPMHAPQPTSYQGQRMNNSGEIAATSFFLMIVAGVLGLGSVALGLVYRTRPRMRNLTIVLATVAALLALSAPVAFAFGLPAAQSRDYHLTTSGPWSSFVGSNSSYGITLTWGPESGWCLAFVAFGVLLVGSVLLFGQRKRLSTLPPAREQPSPAPDANDGRDG